MSKHKAHHRETKARKEKEGVIHTIIEHVFILDKANEYLFESKPNARLFLSEQDFFNEISNLRDEIKTLTIIAELDWADKPLQWFYGFEIARRVRLEEVLCCQIYIVSAFVREYFNGMPQHLARYQILNGRGTRLITFGQVDLNKELYNNPDPPLSLAVVYDMNEMLLQEGGRVIDKLTHDLLYDLKEGAFFNLMDDVAKTIQPWQMHEIGWGTFRKDLHDKLNDSLAFYQIKGRLLASIESIIPSEGQRMQAEPEKKHSIIVLEDDPAFKDRIVSHLERHFEDIFPTASAREAIDRLNADTENKYTAILADWRLYYPDKKSWQQQGYEVLQHAANARLIGLFSLTSLKDHNIHNIRNVLGLDIHLFKKQYLQDAGEAQWDQMAETISQTCDSILVIISGTPTGKKWLSDCYTKHDETSVHIQPLKYKYIQLRKNNWNFHNKELSEESDKIWAYYSSQVLSINLQHCSITNIRDKFGIEVGANDPNIKHILIARRIFFALWFNADMIKQTFERKIWKDVEKIDFKIIDDQNPLVKIYCVFTGDDCDQYCSAYKSTEADRKKHPKLLDNEIATYKLIQNSNTLAFNLCIKTEDFPKGILPEEGAWLTAHGIDHSENKTVDYKANYPDESDEPTKRSLVKLPKDLQEPTEEQLLNAQKRIPKEFKNMG